jgi:uncharacterized protein
VSRLEFSSCCLLILGATLPGAALMGDTQRSSVSNDGAATVPPSTSVVVSEDKTFRNGTVVLSGTLYLPVRAARIPAVVAFHSASSPTRDLPLYSHLKQMLPPLGIAVFVYDRRGNGKSGGKQGFGNFEELAGDGIAAEHMLAQDSRIDPKRLGFWGLSQGGWLSLIAASRSTATAFDISISAPMTTPDVQMNFATASILRISGYPQSEIDIALAARKAVDDFVRGRLDRATAQNRLDAAAARPWFHLIYLHRSLEDPAYANWAKELLNDPLTTLRSVKCPTLIVYGARDPWVPVKASVDALSAGAAQHPNVETVVVAGADHDMNLSTPPKVQIDPGALSDEAPDSPEYFGLIASWLTAHALGDSQGLSGGPPRDPDGYHAMDRQASNRQN